MGFHAKNISKTSMKTKHTKHIMHDKATYWKEKIHQDKVHLAESSCWRLTGRSTEVEDMGSSQDKMLQKIFSRSGTTLRQLVDIGRVWNFRGHLLIRRPQHAGHRTVPAPKFMPRARVLRGP